MFYKFLFIISHYNLLIINTNNINNSNNNINTTNTNGNVRAFRKFTEIRFHDAALWGAATFVTQVTNMSQKDVIIAFRNYFGLSEDELSLECARVSLQRTNARVRATISDLEDVQTIMPKQAIDELEVMIKIWKEKYMK